MVITEVTQEVIEVPELEEALDEDAATHFRVFEEKASHKFV